MLVIYMDAVRNTYNIAILCVNIAFVLIYVVW